MANYYYNQYNATLRYAEGPWDAYGAPFGNYPTLTGYDSYAFDNTTGVYTLVGTSYAKAWGSNSNPLYSFANGNILARYVQDVASGYWMESRKLATTTYYIQGSLVTANILAPDGTYPVNGRHTDGYWYVRGVQAFPTMKVNVNGVWKDAVSGGVNVGGVWKNITDMWVNVGGIWKKS